MTQVFDAIVIGAGQAGPSLAGRLTAAGMKVALVERNLFGGTCVNTGCMPTKTLVASAYAAHLARRSAEFGIAIESPVKIDMKRVKARADAVSTNARTNVETWLRGMEGLTVVKGHARFEGQDVVRVAGPKLPPSAVAKVADLVPRRLVSATPRPALRVACVVGPPMETLDSLGKDHARLGRSVVAGPA